MAGIYVHIPFCRSRCIYCGFFSTTSLEWRTAYVNALCTELYERKRYLKGEEIETIYFGGGTPTQLPVSSIERVLNCIYNIYNVRENVEITVEGNPDDMTPELLQSLKRLGVNRLSMGVQTFSDERLRFLHRRHDSIQAIVAVKEAQKVGFDNVSIDLMFGFPEESMNDWQEDVRMALSLGVQHLSAYSLMYEEGTALGKLLDDGKIQEIDEELSLSMYEHLLNATFKAGFQHYEISNFALPGFQSKHNSSYWHSVPYLGVGAGAHSYDGCNRHYNPDSLKEYLEGAPLEEEILNDDERFNEYVFTGLRTSEGIDVPLLESLYGKEKKEYCLNNARKHIDTGRILYDGKILKLSKSGLFVSNDVMSDLMITALD